MSSPGHPLGHAQISWDEQGQPISSSFDDVYFSKASGLEETQYVFMQHNQLPQRWQQLEAGQSFCVAETGFGTGLNFLSCWHSWREQAPTNAQLHFISVERFPLQQADLQQALALWPQLQPLSQALTEQYPPACNGFHRLQFDQGRVQLTLIFDDAAHAYSQLNAKVDAWFLDGFAPAKNPEMWSPELFQAIAGCSHPGTSFSTFTAAGIVRRGLQQVGFEVRKVKGFAHKREMICGHFSPSTNDHPDNNRSIQPWFDRPQSTPEGRRVGVIGAGIAGASSAYALAQRGFQVDVYEQGPQPGCGASGNPQGVLYLKLPAQPTPSSQIQLSGYLYSLRLFEQLLERSREWDPCGVLQLALDPQTLSKQEKLVELGHYPEQLVRSVDVNQACELAGCELSDGGLLYPLGGWVSPADLCRRLLDQPRVSCHFNRKIHSIEHDGHHWLLFNADRQLIDRVDTLVLANAEQAQQLAPWAQLPLKPIRGQTSRVVAPDQSTPNCVLCGTGYISPPLDQQLCFGASFDLHDQSREIRTQDHLHNLELVKTLSPTLASQLEPGLAQAEGRVGIRCAAPDYVPIVGAVANPEAYCADYGALRQDAKAAIDTPPSHYPGLYVNLAHGSKGMTTAPLCGALVAELISAAPLPLPQTLVNVLNPGRFLIKKLIKGAI